MEEFEAMNKTIDKLLIESMRKFRADTASTILKPADVILAEIRPILEELKLGHREHFNEYMQNLRDNLRVKGSSSTPAAAKTVRRTKQQDKENVEESVVEKSKAGRPRRKAFDNAAENIKVAVTEPLNTKLRRPSIKKEKIDEPEEMPPPKELPQKRGRKKKDTIIKTEVVRSSSRKRTEIIEPAPIVKSERTSDVVLIVDANTVINVDSDDEEVGGSVEKIAWTEDESDDVGGGREKEIEENHHEDEVQKNDDCEELIDSEPKKKGRPKKVTKELDSEVEVKKKGRKTKKVVAKVSEESEEDEVIDEKIKNDVAEKTNSVLLKKINEKVKNSDKDEVEEASVLETKKKGRKTKKANADEASIYTGRKTKSNGVEKTDVDRRSSKRNIDGEENVSKKVKSNNWEVAPAADEQPSLYEDAEEEPVVNKEVDVTKVVEKPSRNDITVVVERNSSNNNKVNETQIISGQKPLLYDKFMNNTYNDTIPSLIPKHNEECLLMVDKTRVIANETVVLDKANETRVLEKPSSLGSKICNETRVIASNATMLIEKVEDVVKPSLQSDMIKKKNEKEIFSPYESSPVKKRVEAFENYAKSGSKLKKGIPPDVGKTGKVTTPTTASRILPPSSISKYTGSASKTLSAMKASAQEFKERELRRREKEQEAAKKKEAMLLAMTEEKRRKREEKENKAKQHREEIEREKQRAVDAQKLKEEKQRLLAAERYENMQKVREDNEKKRLLLRQKMEKKKMEEQKQRPVYMTTKAPLLPTFDCYDSDSEGEEKQHPTVEKPNWLKSENMRLSNRIATFVRPKAVNTLFCTKPKTPDLSQIFQNIEPARLRRNSSAIWNHPPRFTLLPHAEEADDV